MFRVVILSLCYIFSNINIIIASNIDYNHNDVLFFDSIANEIEKIQLDKDRIEYTLELLNNYNSKKESDILLNILRKDALKIQDKYYLQQLYFYEIIAGKRDNDLKKAKIYLDKIKSLCGTEDDYILYFNSLSLIVHETVLNRDYEEAYNIIQKGKMLSQELNNKKIDYILIKCLVYFYNDTENFEKLKELLLVTLKDPKLDPINKRELYGYLANAYKMSKEYDKALMSIENSLVYSLNQKNSINYSMIYQSANVNKLGILLLMNDITNAKKVIDIIDNKTDTTSMNKVSRFNYMINLAKYNYIIKDYDKALKSLRRLNTKKMYRSPYLTKQYYTASILFAKGEKKEGAALFVKTLEESLEYKTKLIQSQRELSQTNTKIQHMLYEKERNEERKMNTSIFFGTFFLLIIAISIYRFYSVGKELKKTLDATQKAAIIARDNDLEKDNFLQTMTQDIEIPLNNVNKLTELLSNKDAVSEDEKRKYSTQIKQSSKKLLNLITNILELSRLESGMMRYTIDYFDLVTLCKENISKALFKNPLVNINFICSLENLFIKGDNAKFSKLIYSLLTASTNIEKEISMTFTLIAIEKSMFCIKIEGSPLILPFIDAKEQNIQNQINSLFVEIFNGSYYLERNRIVITMPTNNIPDDIIIEIDNTMRA